ncbi:DDE-type integrase/transposase/recombinase [Pacificibacter sp.]|uniref:DDE-type integrase/transposase/recombinase n=1 Tax=Pacificibacter sp. TaxID=1917866 RepID=UPI00321A7197
MNVLRDPEPVGRIYLGRFDRVTIGGIDYQVIAGNSVGYDLVSVRENALTQQFTHRDLKAHSLAGNIRVDRNAFSMEHAKCKPDRRDFDLALLSSKERERVGVRWSYCQALQKLLYEGTVKLTYESIGQALDQIKGLAERFFRDFSDEHGDRPKVYGGGRANGLAMVSPTSLRKWFSLYRAEGIVGLVSNRWKSGRKGTRFCSEAETLLMRGASLYLQLDQPTKASVVEDTQRLFAVENSSREKRGQCMLPVPSRNTILSRINRFSPYETVLNREGKAKAQAKFFPVGAGLQLGRPLERVEMDGWTVDLMTLAKSSGLMEKLAPELSREMELDGGKKRWKLFAAICCQTRCLVSLSLSKTENAEAAVDCMQMMVQDKGQVADAVGAMSPWNMHGVPDVLATDNGSAFISHKFLGAAQSIGLDLERPPAGFPQLRGNIERLFGTMSTNLVARLSGRTFSDVVEKGDYPSEARTVLTVQDFADLLVRWVVDVYHNTPHQGLGGETPLECWSRLENTYGVRPSPDRRSQRIAFGVPMSRKISNVGLQIMGVRYNNEFLMQHLRQSRERDLELRWLPENIGEIEVKINDEWHAIQSTLPEFKGRSARDWISARNIIRKGNPNTRKASSITISNALEEIDRLNAAAGERAGILSERWDDEMVKKFETVSLIGFKAGHEQSPTDKTSGYGTLVEVPSAQVQSAQAVPDPVSAPENVSSTKSNWKI